MGECTAELYQVLDLNDDQMETPEQIEDIVAFHQRFPPQTYGGKMLWDPRDPDNKENETRMPTIRGTRIQASDLSLTLRNDDQKSLNVKAGVDRLLTADPTIVEKLAVGAQMHVLRFDETNGDVTFPDGFDLQWMLNGGNVAELYAEPWAAIGKPVSPWPSVEIIRDVIGGVPHSWARAEADKLVLYASMPDLRIEPCRNWLLERYSALNDSLGLRCMDLGSKASWLWGHADVMNTPATQYSAAPWLPTPYPCDSYRDANVDLTMEALGFIAAEYVTMTTTARYSSAEAVAHGLPPDHYTTHRDGGVSERACESFYGTRQTNWTYQTLLDHGFRERYVDGY